MILELKIKNFLSFKEEVTFSFEATKDKTLEDYLVVEIAPGVRILRLAIVYGANASGKSNLVEAFEFLRYFWLKQPENKDVHTGAIPFLLDENTPSEPSEFTLIFYIENTKYRYFLRLDDKKIYSEKLEVYPGTQPALIFDRVLNNGVSEIKFNTHRIKISQIIREEISVKCLPNTSVLSAYNQINASIPELEAMKMWIQENYGLPCIEPRTSLVSHAEEVILNNPETKKYILNFLQRADFNIYNINTELTESTIPESMLSFLLKNMPDATTEEQERLKNERILKHPKTEFEHRVKNKAGKVSFFKLQKDFQSQGTIRTLGLSCVLYETMKRGAFLAIDEMESSLHPRLAQFIIEEFLRQKGQSQLLLTTHYDALLEDGDLLRNDNFWFTNKIEDGSTEIYSLSDFKGLNRIASLNKAYKYGRFGAIPNI